MLVTFRIVTIEKTNLEVKEQRCVWYEIVMLENKIKTLELELALAKMSYK